MFFCYVTSTIKHSMIPHSFFKTSKNTEKPGLFLSHTENTENTEFFLNNEFHEFHELFLSHTENTEIISFEHGLHGLYGWRILRPQYLFCDFRDFCVTFILDIALQYLFRISFVFSGSFGIQRKSVESGRSVVFLVFGISSNRPNCWRPEYPGIVVVSTPEPRLQMNENNLTH